LNRDAPKAPTVIRGNHGLKFLPYGKANAIAGCLENRFTHNELCEEHYERWVEALVKDVLQIEDGAPSERIRTCEMKRLIISLRKKGL
jgi:hypothetical protein